MIAFALFIVFFLAVGTLTFYWTTGKVLTILRPGASPALAALISLAGWIAGDSVIHWINVVLSGNVQIHIADLDAGSLTAGRLDEYALYAIAHGLALLLHVKRRTAKA